MQVLQVRSGIDVRALLRYSGRAANTDPAHRDRIVFHMARYLGMCCA